MDKYERKVRIEQMEALHKSGEHAEALEIADTIDWHTERKIRTLRVVSEIYKINRRYEDAFQTLTMAYDKDPDDPIKRKVVYDLCELSIKMNEFAYAVRFLKEFAVLAPKDPGRYMLQYKLYKAQEVSYDERIEVLEEFKKKYFGDFRPRWAYELACLYHMSGYSEKCVEACDEIILWFVKGPYVTKAMELKMQHVPLSPDQQEKYDHRNDSAKSEILYEKQHSEQTAPIYSDPGDDTSANMPTGGVPGIPAIEKKPVPIEIKKVDVSNEPTIKLPEKLNVPGEEKPEVSVNLGKYSTINLQEELRANMAELQERTGEPLREKEEKITTQAEPMEPDAGMVEIKSTAANDTDTEPEASNIVPMRSGKRPDTFKDIISEEYDGQLSLNVPDVPPEIEKQITGQLDIDTVLAQWDKLKEESQARRINAARRKSLEQTNDIAKDLVGVIPGFKIKTLPDDRIPSIPGMQGMQGIQGINGVPVSQETSGLPVMQNEPEISVPVPQTRPEPVMQQEEPFAASPDSGSGSDINMIQMSEFPEEASVSAAPVFAETAGTEEPEKPEEADEVEEIEEIEDQPEEDSEPVRQEIKDTKAEKAAEEPAETTGAETVKHDADEKEKKEKALKEREGNGPVKDETGRIVLPEPVDIKEFDEDEKEIFASYTSMHGMADKLVSSLKKVSMTACQGNIVITGNEQTARVGLAYAFAKQRQLKDELFGGKIAKISAEVFNTKDVQKSLKALNGGVLVIERAGGLSDETMNAIGGALNDPDLILLVILEDKKSQIKYLAKKNDWFNNVFSVNIDIPVYTNDDLVLHAREYAREKEYVIDELGILALYTRIAEMQTAEHIVTVDEVNEILDEAIDHVDKKNIGHLFDVLFAKRYNKDDLIILREKDFIKK